MLKVDTKDLKQLTKNLQHARKYDFKDAIYNTLRTLGKKTKAASVSNIKKSFTLRDKSYIPKSVGVWSKPKSQCSSINNLQTDVGEWFFYKGKTSERLKKQEEGLPIIARGKYTFAATPSARSGSYSKKVTKSNLLTSLNAKRLDQLVANPTSNPSKQAAQAQAFSVRQKKKFNVLLAGSNGRKGIYTVSKKSVKLLYALRDKKTSIKRTQWLKPATDRVVKLSEQIYMKEAHKVLEKSLSKGLKA